jgi:hypothetical protein
MNELQINTRKTILNTLDLLGSISKQSEYKNSVPFVNIPAELIEQWNNHNRIKNNNWYTEIWTEKEYLLLEAFNKNFQEKLECLPKKLPDIPQILENENWIEIIKMAKKINSYITTNI